jgi:hypothetical protein
MVLRKAEESFLSSNGSCVHFIPCGLRAGSRAGMRGAAPGRRDVNEESVAGAEFGSLGFLASCICLESGGCEGTLEEFAGEPALVSGVRLWFEACDVVLFMAEPLLKTDDVVLAWELAEPTPFRMSPCSDSVSSAAAGWVASDDEGSDLMPSR